MNIFNLCYLDQKCNLTFHRSTVPIITYDSRPRYVTAADLNMDKHSDLVIANSGIDNIGIRLGDGNRSFTNQITYSTGVGSSPYWVSVADFNNDTLLDIAVANYGTNSLGVFLGYGNGTFANQLTFSLGSSHPVSLGVGHFNNDKQLDIVVVNNGTFNLTILLGFGNGSFQIDRNYSMGYDSMPSSMVVADFNNDNRLDIVVVNYGTSDLTVLLATENGTFLINKYLTGKDSNPSSVTLGDFNNDSYIDIAIVNSGTHNIGVFIGNGNGTFRTLTTYSTDSKSYLLFIVTGDFNNDYELDLIVANSGDDNIIVFEGHGNGSFSIITTQSTGVNSNPCAIAVDYFDNDNILDIAVVNNGNNYVIVLTSYDYHITATQTTYSTGDSSYPNFIVVDYFNNDKQLDIVVANLYSSDIGVFLASGSGTFQAQVAFPTIEYYAGPYSIAVGDFNKDNKLDLAVTMNWYNTVEIYFGQGNGKFEYGDYYFVGDYYVYPYSIATADFNKDTNLDLVTANCNTDNVAVFLGNGNGTFRDGVLYATEYYACPIFVSVGDFNSDGLLDLVSANYYGASISIFLGNGDGTFQNSTTISTDGYYTSWLVVEDLNNDTKRDIVFTSPDYSFIGILLGYGNGTFANIYGYSTGFQAFPWSLVLGDFNRDTKVDIAVANAEDPSVGIFFGDAHGYFDAQDPIFLDGVSYSYSIATGYFNNDSQLDIVVGNIGTDGISVLLLLYLINFGNETDNYQGSGLHPFSVTICDFNNDNVTDIVVANSGNDTVQILIGYENGIFMNNITYSTGINSHPQYALTADFNKDGQLDIAVVNSYDGNLMIFLISTNRTHYTSTLYSTGSQSFPNSIGIGDFNKDGWVDIVVANNNTDNLGVFLGFDYPTFTTNNLAAPKHGSLPYYVVVGDFNNDSRWDIAVAYQKISSIGIFLGNGDGTFLNQSLYLLDESSEPNSLAIGDFNNDNKLDIAAANLRSNSITILLGNGNGTFVIYDCYSTGFTSPGSIAVGDFNNDIRQDLVVTNEKGNNVGVFIGYGNGSFAEQISYEMPNGSSPLWVVVSDFNKDNISDIAVANRDGNNIGILLGYANGTFRNVTMYSTGNGSLPCSIAVGDFNKDNLIDIVVANSGSKNIGIFSGIGNGTFSLQATYSTGIKSSLVAIAVQDLNNDTILDIAVSDWGTGDGNIGVLYGLKNGNFLVPIPYSTGFNSQTTSIAICDFNNDGRLDFAVSNSQKNNIGIMLRNGSEPFGVQTTFSTGNGSGPYSVAVTDFNNDDQLDIAVANFKTNNIGIFFGYGNGSFANQQTYSTGIDSSPTSIAIGDFNDDKQFDIVVANSNTSNIGFLLGSEKGTFASEQTYSTGEGSGPTSVAVADLNKDNQTDIVVTNGGINNVLVFYGLGNATFTKSTPFSFEYGSFPISAAIGDFNNDTWLDIAVANYGPGYVEILLQTC